MRDDRACWWAGLVTGIDLFHWTREAVSTMSSVSRQKCSTIVAAAAATMTRSVFHVSVGPCCHLVMSLSWIGVYTMDAIAHAALVERLADSLDKQS